MITERLTSAKAFDKDVFINQERKLGDRRRSDTVVVSTINYADQRSGDAFRRGSEAPPAPLREIIECLGFGGSMVARLKLKGIDGRAHQKWSLRLNLTQHGETYQVQTVQGLTD